MSTFQTPSAGDPACPVRFVVVVEDLDCIRDLLSRAISKLGYTPWPMNTGKDALEFKEHISVMPSFIFIDVKLPDMSGFDVARQLHEQHPELKIVLMSGFPPDYYEVDGARIMKEIGASFLFKGADFLTTLRSTLAAAV